MSWMRIRLDLARSRDFPDGSARHGYEFVLPLDTEGKLDRAAYDKSPPLATVHRYWAGEGDSHGLIQRSGRGKWVFSFDPGEGEAEAVPHLQDHLFRPGEYLGVREPDGSEHTFRVVLVEPARH
jgi:hypothetical protein